MNSPYNGEFKVTQTFKTNHDGLDLVGLHDKEVHSTVNGVVELAGWENAGNKSQGFGIYVKIKKDNSVDRYYFGHLSKAIVKAGDRVRIGQVIGIEGSTGKSTGSHCHYCIRGNGLRSQIRDVCSISGIPNKIGIFDDGYLARMNATKVFVPDSDEITKIAKEVIKGKWGNGSKRKTALANAGYDFTVIQNEVNKILKG
jgi:murein DD-endopeptidase MepM/ murein hydrolase activator NlpD